MNLDPSKLERILRLTPVELSSNGRASLEFPEIPLAMQTGDGILYVKDDFYLRIFNEREPREVEELEKIDLDNRFLFHVDNAGNIHVVKGDNEVGNISDGKYCTICTFPQRIDFVSGATLNSEPVTYVLVEEEIFSLDHNGKVKPFANVGEIIEDMIVGSDNKIYVMTESRKLLVYDMTGDPKETRQPIENINLDRGDDGPFSEEHNNFRIYVGAKGTVYVSGGNKLGVLTREGGEESRGITCIYVFELIDEIEGVVETLDGRLLVLARDILWDCFQDEDGTQVVRGLRVLDNWNIDNTGDQKEVHGIALSKTFPSRLYVGAGEKEIFAFDMHWDYVIPQEALAKLT